MTITAFGIGTTSTTAKLSALTVKVPDPKAPFQYYAEYQTMASAKTIGRGLPVIVWQWDFLTRAQRDQLRQFCTTPSAIVYIDTQENDTADAWKQYKCYCRWPLEENREATRRLPFRLEFIQCELQTP